MSSSNHHRPARSLTGREPPHKKVCDKISPSEKKSGLDPASAPPEDDPALSAALADLTATNSPLDQAKIVVLSDEKLDPQPLDLPTNLQSRTAVDQSTESGASHSSEDDSVSSSGSSIESYSDVYEGPTGLIIDEDTINAFARIAECLSEIVLPKNPQALALIDLAGLIGGKKLKKEISRIIGSAWRFDSDGEALRTTTGGKAPRGSTGVQVLPSDNEEVPSILDQITEPT
ncbi:hypothetical protein ACHAPJ_009619 [Fusarium lateritium]